MPLIVKTNKQRYCVNFREDTGRNKDGTPNEGEGKILAKFYVEPLSPSELDAIMKAHRISEWDAPKKRMPQQRFQDINFLEATKDRIDKIIVDWDGVEGRNGDGATIKLECNRTNKLLIYENDPAVINYVLERASELSELEVREEEKKTKNSKTSQTGKQKQGKDQ